MVHILGQDFQHCSLHVRIPIEQVTVDMRPSTSDFVVILILLYSKACTFPSCHLPSLSDPITQRLHTLCCWSTDPATEFPPPPFPQRKEGKVVILEPRLLLLSQTKERRLGE